MFNFEKTLLTITFSCQYREIKNDDKGKEIKVMRERISYSQFVEIMTKASQRKRKMIRDKIKNYCKYIDKDYN